MLLLQNNGQVLVFFFFLCASLKEPSSGIPLKRTRAPHSHVLTVRQLQHFTITGSEHLWTNNNTNQNKIDAAAQMRWSVVLRSERTQEDPQFHASSSHYDYYTNIHTITIRKPLFFMSMTKLWVSMLSCRWFCICANRCKQAAHHRGCHLRPQHARKTWKAFSCRKKKGGKKKTPSHTRVWSVCLRVQSNITSTKRWLSVVLYI